ncbi:PhoH family protein [Ligilactobacillus pobuzihii]|uniref:PhoH-like protein n=1 Tax=Ligilactobacillus pobuzihii TaxID=449659 RepID=A0A0R2LN34_9LACO|nr:PhoH family protein [Ligilactobacillus pobuzihii]KRK11396.1 PhoH protein [Ligilactobacillus pobuzihii E100301 = KCTC 13174]KRO02711.1 PhoH protein [Ligilactobacillus pobuzihii]GEN47338.1 phosphate starvation protein PhoH [Ligilactobacillus pobuzihii]
MSEKQVIEKELHVAKPEVQAVLFGVNDNYLKLIEEGLNVTIRPFGDVIKIEGDQDAASKATEVIKKLTTLVEQGVGISESDVLSALKMAQNGTLTYFQDLYKETLIKDNNGRPVRVKNFGQRNYVQAIKNNDLVFGIGPAGTGKTFLAVVMAVAALKKKEVERLILTRPAVEAGESLGFLPGDLKEKVDPYLRPIYDALYAILGSEHTERLIERGVIEIAPLAYMRGRTLDNAFVILDEAQNSTRAQMKMFLTRLGFGSKMIVNGDISQIDLPKGHQQSGLIDARKILQGLPHIKFIQFSGTEVVRHPVVSEIIAAYDKVDNQ